MIYALPKKRSRGLGANLACLQDCAGEDVVLNLARIAKLDLACAPVAAVCGSGKSCC